ncbi:MAG: proline racemase family protein [Acidimicrobiia bacterium]
MEEHRALEWRPPSTWEHLTVIESHAGGEPFRVVVDGLPDIPGDTVLDRRRYAEENLDPLRRRLMWEPRGHSDMYGGWLGPPTTSEGDLSVLFLHNEGFSTMCGHGIIALSKVVIDTGMVPASQPETTLRIETPAGLVEATSSVFDGRVVSTRFRNVPSFVSGLDLEVFVETIGQVRFDLAFGGAFYAIVDATSLDLDLDDSLALITRGREIKQAIVASRDIRHPEDDDLGFLYGVIFTGPPLDPSSHSRNVCVFADGEIDRSPTGTGVSARLAILHARGEVAAGRDIIVESITGSRFGGRIVEVLDGDPERVIPEISGSAHLIGRAEMWFDPVDELGEGFFLR